MRSLILCLALAASPASGFLALDLPPRHPLFDFPLRSLALGPHPSLSTLPVGPLASTFSALLANTPSAPHWRVGERGLEIALDLPTHLDPSTLHAAFDDGRVVLKGEIVKKSAYELDVQVPEGVQPGDIALEQSGSRLTLRVPTPEPEAPPAPVALGISRRVDAPSSAGDSAAPSEDQQAPRHGAEEASGTPSAARSEKALEKQLDAMFDLPSHQHESKEARGEEGARATAETGTQYAAGRVPGMP